MFEESEDGRFVPRSIFIDMDDRTIDQVMDSELGKIMEDNQFVCDKEDWSNNFARGYFSVGKRNIDKILHILCKKVLRNCYEKLNKIYI